MQIKLTTLGAKSGQRRTATLYAWADDDRLVIVGSRGGAAHHPSWVHNLRAHPMATVAGAGGPGEVVAREVTDPTERERLWRLVIERFPLYASYQRKTSRQIPLFVLERQ